ncbi:hypothetical protein IV203_037438 [Nitzschia inconspicua]|uniref:Uncharacterized protein n=1 Tax=Nitzschia inconspicua TaxID=303405 RepID=A0A9K3LNW8_9STRA|nr:hypothetical protein IV203_037438 [Nitzschia inconspicua]
MPPSQEKQQVEKDSNKAATQPSHSHTNPAASVSNGDPRNPANNVQRQTSLPRRSNQSAGRPMMMNTSSTQQQYQQQQQQQQQYHGNASSSNRHSTLSSQPTPLFERLVTEEVQGLKTYQRIVENQSRRLQELERIHGDLELRLEVESRGKAQLESTLEQREREWAMKFRGLQEDRDQLKAEVEKEKEKNAKLLDQVNRKDQDIHRMLQRKYDNQRDAGGGQSIRANRIHNTINSSERHGTPPRDVPEGTPPQQFNKSPHEILAASGSMETVRIRNVQNLLNDFFSG